MSEEFKHVVVDELPDAPNPTRHKKEVDEAVGATEFGFNVITADPGERIPWGFHHHPDHEELFYVIAGRVVFETEDGEYEVGAGEAFFVPRGKRQRGVAVGETAARLIATGAPKATDSAVIEETCPACGSVTGREFRSEVVDETTVYVLSCTACGEETDRLTPGPS